jgi:alpha-galactosidase
VQKIVDLGKYPAKVVATQDRTEALRDADFVVVTILAGGVEIWRHDIEIPKQFGVDINIGDTRGPSGIFRALRTIPPMLDIAHDMERLCPKALMLNYTNPMAMLCRAMQRESSIQLTGLCHSVQGTAEMLAEWIGAPMEEITYTCAGINHMAWYLKYEWKGEDAYPLIRKAITERPEVYNEEIVRNEMFLALDRYVTESSGHNSEYNWWFRKRPDLIEKYCTHGTGWNPGVYGYIVDRYTEREGTWREEARKWFAAETPIDLQRGHEYAAYIMNAILGGEPFEYNGNVRNTGLVTNLPQDACVEVPVWASRKGLEPVYVGALPPQCALLTNLSASIEEMAVEAAITGNPRLVYQAIAHDPLTAAVLSLAEIKEMVNCMLEKNKEYLPTFRHFQA